MKRISLVMCYWCHLTDHGEDIRGNKTVRASYAKIDDAIKEGGIQNVTPSNIEPLVIFRWTLASDQQEHVLQWAEDIIAMKRRSARTALAIADENKSSADQPNEDESRRQRRLMSVFD